MIKFKAEIYMNFSRLILIKQSLLQILKTTFQIYPTTETLRPNWRTIYWTATENRLDQ